uniref:IS sequence n=1 Tax=Rhodococcus erythropolis TaxID=1833 RepID=Q6XMZ6_RHOER|nr:IS sequence [Rhodococcus erythropolis]
MTTPPTPAGPVDPIGADLIALLKALKLGALKDTLPERLALARQHQLSHVAFLELLLADEVSRRESRSATLRSAKAGLDQSMRIDTWNALDDLRYDRSLLSDLVSLRFAEAGHSVLVLGPVVINGCYFIVLNVFDDVSWSCFVIVVSRLSEGTQQRRG